MCLRLCLLRQVQKIVAGSWDGLQQLYAAPLAAAAALQQTAPQRWAQDVSPAARLERLACLPQARLAPPAPSLPCPHCVLICFAASVCLCPLCHPQWRVVKHQLLRNRSVLVVLPASRGLLS